MFEIGDVRHIEEFDGYTVLMDQFEEFNRLINNYENGFEEELNHLAYEYGISVADFLNNLYEQLEFLKLRMWDEDYQPKYKDNNLFTPNVEDALQNNWEQLERYEDEEYNISATERARNEFDRDYEGY